MTRNIERSRAIFAEGQRYLPGGVDSPVRSFRGVGGDPVVVASGAGSRLTDVDGNEYIDYCGSWGPLILGHAHPGVVEAVSEAATRGLTYGAATEAEVELGAAWSASACRRSRWCASSAPAPRRRCPRCAWRAPSPNRTKVLKFDGCYHGHADGLLVQAGSGVATLSLPDSAGVPRLLRGRDAGRALQRRRRPSRRSSLATAARSRPSSSSRWRRTWASCRRRRASSKACATHLRRIGRAADLRRGDHGLPRRPRRLSGRCRGVTPDLTCLGKVDRRRHAGGCLRRPPRRHGAHRAAGARLPGRHALGQPAGDGRRPRHDPRPVCSPASSKRWRRRRSACRPASSPRRLGQRWLCASTASARC